ncbi:MAG: flagellar hook-length control protein FliK [Sphingobacteriia bacterium]|nr:flagellar hook-length control protein FliK [Sphingobacteriia bacterium]
MLIAPTGSVITANQQITQVPNGQQVNVGIGSNGIVPVDANVEILDSKPKNLFTEALKQLKEGEVILSSESLEEQNKLIAEEAKNDVIEVPIQYGLVVNPEIVAQQISNQLEASNGEISKISFNEINLEDAVRDQINRNAHGNNLDVDLNEKTTSEVLEFEGLLDVNNKKINVDEAKDSAVEVGKVNQIESNKIGDLALNDTSDLALNNTGELALNTPTKKVLPVILSADSNLEVGSKYQAEEGNALKVSDEFKIQNNEQDVLGDNKNIDKKSNSLESIPNQETELNTKNNKIEFANVSARQVENVVKENINSKIEKSQNEISKIDNEEVSKVQESNSVTNLNAVRDDHRFLKHDIKNDLNAIDKISEATLPAHEQIRLSVIKNIQGNNSKVVVQLEPKELGKVEITMKMNEESISGISIAVEKIETLELIQRDFKHLEKSLSENGIKIASDNISFNLRNDTNQQAKDNREFLEDKKEFLRSLDDIGIDAKQDNLIIRNYISDHVLDIRV